MAASMRQIKESKKKRLRRQWDLLVKRADAWFKECEQPPNFVMMVLRGDRAECKAPDHMSAFANSPTVVDKFKEVSLGRLYMPSQRNDVARQTEEPLVLPYADSFMYSWDMLVFLMPAILRRNGIYGHMVEEDGEIEHPALSHQIHQKKEPVEQLGTPCQGHQEEEDDVENNQMEEVNQLPPYALNHHADEVEQQAPPFNCQEQKAADQFSVPSQGDQEEEVEVEHPALSSWHHEEEEVERLPPISVGHLEDEVDQPGPSCWDPQEEEEVKQPDTSCSGLWDNMFKQPNPSFTDHQMEKEEVKQPAPFGLDAQNLVIEKSKIVQCTCPDQAITQNLCSVSKTYTISDHFEFSHSNFMD